MGITSIILSLFRALSSPDAAVRYFCADSVFPISKATANVVIKNRALGLESRSDLHGLYMMLVAWDGKRNDIRCIEKKFIRYHCLYFRIDIAQNSQTNRKGHPG